MSPPTAEPRLTWRAGGLVLLLGIVLTLLATAKILWPVLTRPESHMIGDGTHPESYRFDLTNLLVSRSELAASGMPRDGVPVLDEPPRFSVADVDSLAHAGRAKYLVSNDLVLGVERGGAACCYPLLALQWHEVVNDTLGGEAIAVVYNPLCDLAVVVRRGGTQAGAGVGPKPPRFGASGLVWNSNLLLYDRGAEVPSLWSPLEARAVAGPAAARAESLRVLPSAVLPWHIWRAMHPDTQVLARQDAYYERYRRQPYAPYFGDDRLRFPVRATAEIAGLGPKVPCLVIRDRARGLILPIPRLLARANGADRTTVTFGGKRYLIRVNADPLSAWIDPAGPLPARAVASGFLFAWRAACPGDSILP